MRVNLKIEMITINIGFVVEMLMTVCGNILFKSILALILDILL